MSNFDALPESVKQKITRLTGRLTDMTFQSFEILPGTEDAFTAARKFACLDQDLKPVFDADVPDEIVDANTLDKDFLTFVGPPGCGKTHLSVSALRVGGESMGIYYEYWTIADLLRTLREKTEKKPRDIQTEYTSMEYLNELDRAGINIDNSYNGIIKRLCGETFPEHYLLLDDLGVEKYTDWALEILQLIVDKRYIGEFSLQTIFTTNDLKKIPPRIRSRLLSGVVVPVTASDYRLRTGKLSTLKAIHRNDQMGTKNAK